VAVIDVFRAFTTVAVALANGATNIVMVRSVEEALALRDAGIGQICFAPKGRDWLLRGQAWGRFKAGLGGISRQSLGFSDKHRTVSTSATRPSRSRMSISAARPSFSGPAPEHRELLRLEPEP
jgi:hypothetical protein